MKNHVFLLIFTSISTFSFSQSLVHAWTHTWGNADSAIAPDLAVDDNSNVYAAGSFKGTIDFEPGIGSTILTSSAGGFGSSTYIIKYDSSGHFRWIKHIKATSQHLASKIVYDPDGFIYVSGYFTGTADFNPGPGVYNLTGIGSNDEMYLLKLDLDGNFIWAIKTQGVGNKYVGCISLDDQGNIVLGGIFNGTADFDPGVAVSSYTSTSLMNDAFFVKYSDAGTLIWAKAIFGNHRVEVLGVDVDELANVYYVGFFDDQRDFDPGPGMFLLQAFGPSDAWVMKLNALGEFQWLKRLGNDGENIATDVVVNDNYGLFVAGSFSADIDFDQGPPITILTASNWDSFIWKMDTHGEYKWAGQFAGISFDRANAITMDDNGDLYISGYFNDSVDFDPGPGSYLLTSTGNNDHEDAFVVKLRPNGQFVWAEQAGGLEDDAAGALQLDPKGNIFATGGFQGKAGFFLGDTEIDSLVSKGSVDIFLTHWNQCHETYYTLVEVSCSASYISPSGHYTWTQSGIYQDTIRNHEGCDSVLTIDLSIVIVNPEVTIITDGTGLSAVENATSYQWLDCDNKNNPIPGETNQEFYPSQSGNYAVVVDILGCKAISECVYLCLDTYNTLIEVSCSASYLSPSGHYTWTQSGIYQDTIENEGGCDSVLTINLELNEESHAEWNLMTCDTSYISPSGQYIWTQSGIYQDTITNLAGCDSVLTINLDLVVLNPQVDFLLEGDGLFAVEENASYQWLECQKGTFVPVNGATQQTFVPAHTGSYAVFLQQEECTTMSDCYFIMLTAIEEADPLEDAILYPNPTTNGFSIQLPSRLDEVKVVLHSVTGQEVYELKFHDSDFLRFENPLEPGIYFVHMYASRTGKVFKLIVQ